jgi:hypothetical protein
MRSVLLLVALGATLCSGCAVSQLHSDQDKLRSVFLDLYTNQTLDNLVRAANGLPIIQIDYAIGSADVSIMDTVNATDMFSTTHTKTVSAAATRLVSVMRTTMNTLGAGFMTDDLNKVALSASPFVGGVETYHAYLQFLAIPGSLQITPTPPPPGAAHVVCQFRGDYYWVPIDFADKFYQLSLCTTVDRGKLLEPPPKYFSVTVQSIVWDKCQPGQCLVTLDKIVPNKAGSLALSNDTRVTVVEKPRTGGKRIVASPDILCEFNPNSPPLLGPGTKARLSLEGIEAPPPTTQDLLDAVPFLQTDGVHTAPPAVDVQALPGLVPISRPYGPG